MKIKFGVIGFIRRRDDYFDDKYHYHFQIPPFPRSFYKKIGEGEACTNSFIGYKNFVCKRDGCKDPECTAELVWTSITIPLILLTIFAKIRPREVRCKLHE